MLSPLKYPTQWWLCTANGWRHLSLCNIKHLREPIMLLRLYFTQSKWTALLKQAVLESASQYMSHSPTHTHTQLFHRSHPYTHSYTEDAAIRGNLVFTVWQKDTSTCRLEELLWRTTDLLINRQATVAPEPQLPQSVTCWPLNIWLKRPCKSHMD